MAFMPCWFPTEATKAHRAEAYLTTRGRDKVGFTVVGKAEDDGPEYIGGLRGAVERNAMRLYLAIDAYLDAVDEG
jgi:hypothetical protein